MDPDDNTVPLTSARETALACVDAGITATQPEALAANAIAFDPEDDVLQIKRETYNLGAYDELFIVGGGKASGKLARALEDILEDRITDGVIVTNAPVETDRIDVIEGRHPVPDERGVEGTKRLLELAANADEGTLILTLITGGGSALLPAPADGLSLEDLQSVTNDLLESGATIHEQNWVRKHLSAIKGGGLAQVSAPATVVSLVISDVVGDDLDVIASGPTVPDPTTFEDAREICGRYGLSLPDSVEAYLEAGLEGAVPETPGPESPIFDAVEVHILANGLTALSAAQDVAAERGYNTCLLTSCMEGEASDVGTVHAGIATEIRATGNPVEPPAVVFSGGETTVTIGTADRDGTVAENETGTGTSPEETQRGHGGPNQELALSASLSLSEADNGTVLASVDTDGIDGRSDAAGAIVDAETATPLEHARRALETHNTTPFLAAAGALIRTGPTGTNVNDLRVIVVPEPSDE